MSNTIQPALTIAQLILFNSVKHARDGSCSGKIRHRCDSPLPLYIGIKVHAVTRKKDLVNILFELGMSVSYDRVLQINTGLANALCDRYQQDQLVCSINLKRSVFTVGALDNCDHNPSSSTAKDSFHGTSISLFQLPNEAIPAVNRDMHLLQELVSQHDKRKVAHLPHHFADVPPAVLPTKVMVLPSTSTSFTPTSTALHDSYIEESIWLQHVQVLSQKK